METQIQPTFKMKKSFNTGKFLCHTVSVAALMPLSLCHSSPLITGARLAGALLYRYAFFFINPHQRILQFGPASGSLYGTRGSIITAALADARGLSVYWCILLSSRDDKTRSRGGFRHNKKPYSHWLFQA